MLRRLLGFIIGLVYIVVAGFMAVMASGGGHINLIWLPALLPSIIGGLLYPLAGALIADLRPRYARITLFSALAVNYLLTAWMLYSNWDEIVPDVLQTISRSPGNFFVMAAIYGFAHIVIWCALIMGIRNARLYPEETSAID